MKKQKQQKKNKRKGGTIKGGGKKHQGKKIKFTPKLVQKIYFAFRKYFYYQKSAEELGISADTLNRREKDDNNVAEAIARGRERHLDEQADEIRDNKDWRAKAWDLEHKNRKRFGEKAEIEHSGGVNVSISYADGKHKRKGK